MAYRAVRQRGSGMRAFGLISAQLFAGPQQQNLAVLDLHFQTPVFGHIGDTRNAMQSHDCPPDRRLLMSLVPIARFSQFPAATA
ncbi:hypothetical protein D9M73_245810 [compost metagenome]